MPKLALCRTVALAAAVLCAQPSLAADLEAVPTGFIRTEFYVRLLYGFHSRREQGEFFGDVGPTAGCETLKRIASEIAERDVDGFRPAWVGAVKRAVPANFIAGADQRLLPVQLQTLYGLRIAEALRAEPGPILAGGIEELTRRAQSWAKENGFTGRRLGYDSSGQSFWRGNAGTPSLICALPPEDRPAALGDWRRD